MKFKKINTLNEYVISDDVTKKHANNPYYDNIEDLTIRQKFDKSSRKNRDEKTKKLKKLNKILRFSDYINISGGDIPKTLSVFLKPSVASK